MDNDHGRSLTAYRCNTGVHPQNTTANMLQYVISIDKDLFSSWCYNRHGHHHCHQPFSFT